MIPLRKYHTPVPGSVAAGLLVVVVLTNDAAVAMHVERFEVYRCAFVGLATDCSHWEGVKDMELNMSFD